MSDIHTIRLHGPWQATMLECFEFSTLVENQPGFATQKRVKIPSDWGDWLGPTFRGRVAYDRRFGRPTQLDADQKVWLVIDEIDDRGTVSLNGQQICQRGPGDPPSRIEIASRLQGSNQLRIEVELPIDSDRGSRSGLSGGLIGGVRLEIDQSK